MNLQMIPDTFGVSLHTDQQSLILGEMMNARSKLQEENQLLRDKLQDAEMMIRLLQMRLQESTGSPTAKVKSRSSQESTLTSRRVGLTFDWNPKRKSSTNRKSNTTSRKKDTFKNEVVPGKKTFKLNTFGSETGATLSIGAVSVLSSKGRPELFHRGPSLSARKTQSTESMKSSSMVKPMPEVVKPPTNRFIPAFSEEQFQGDSQQVRSVIGKLAQVVINEYSNSEDDNFIFE